MFSFWKKKDLKNGNCTVNFQKKAIYVVGSHLHGIACDPLLILKPHASVEKIGEAVRDCVSALKPESLSRVAAYNPVAEDSICFHVKIGDNGVTVRLYAIAGKGIEPHDAPTMSCAKDVEAIGAALRSFYEKEQSKEVPPPAKENRPGAALVPDSPAPFGYKCMWLAIKTEKTQAVCESLSLKNIKPGTWKDGIKAAYSKNIFVTPPVKGWTLVAGWLPELDGGKQQPELEKILKSISRTFGEAQYFGTHRVVEYQAWAKATGGDLQRAYAWTGCSGEILTNVGQRTLAEVELGLGLTDKDFPHEEDFFERAPHEGDVMELAEKWSINPCELDKMNLSPGLGIIGNLTQL